jgi:hypothetical protein
MHHTALDYVCDLGCISNLFTRIIFQDDGLLILVLEIV